MLLIYQLRKSMEYYSTLVNVQGYLCMDLLNQQGNVTAPGIWNVLFIFGNVRCKGSCFSSYDLGHIIKQIFSVGAGY